MQDAYRMLGAEIGCGQCRCMAQQIVESNGGVSPDGYTLQAAE